MFVTPRNHRELWVGDKVGICVFEGSTCLQWRAGPGGWTAVWSQCEAIVGLSAIVMVKRSVQIPEIPHWLNSGETGKGLGKWMRDEGLKGPAWVSSSCVRR